MAPRDGQFVRSQIFRIYEYVTEVQEATLANRFKESLINPSFRRRPESIALHSLDPGLRRDDEQRIIETYTNG